MSGRQYPTSSRTYRPRTSRVDCQRAGPQRGLGWGGRNRTFIRGFRDHCSTVELLPSVFPSRSGGDRTLFLSGKNRAHGQLCFGPVGRLGIEPSSLRVKACSITLMLTSLLVRSLELRFSLHVLLLVGSDGIEPPARRPLVYSQLGHHALVTPRNDEGRLDCLSSAALTMKQLVLTA